MDLAPREDADLSRRATSESKAAMTQSAHQTPDVPIDDDPDTPDPTNDWPDKERHRPDEVREPPRPRTPPIREPQPPAQP
jgi:hypothetical protein